MRALTVNPGQPHSLSLDEVPSPPKSDGAVLVRALALGICGTDREIIEGLYGAAPDGAERLIIGHESLGQVEDAPAECGVARGDLIVGIVRRPDPVPCPACAAGEWDMCRNGQYTERGIKQRDGYGSEQFRVEPDFLVKVDRELGFIGVLLAGACERRCESLGAYLSHRFAQCRVATTHCPGDRRRAGRLVGGVDRRATRS
jgi:threonine dehydrogenase-like Zn-dependent dehydrogenase